MEVNLGLLTFAFLCFKIFHSWAVEFLNQSGLGEDIVRLIHILLSGPSITNSSMTKNLLISFDFHSHNFFLPMLGRDTKHSVGTRMHSLARLTYTSPLGLTGWLPWEVKVVGSGRGLASHTVILGKGSVVSTKPDMHKYHVFWRFLSDYDTTCMFVCVSAHKMRLFSWNVEV